MNCDSTTGKSTTSNRDKVGLHCSQAQCQLQSEPPLSSILFHINFCQSHFLCRSHAHLNGIRRQLERHNVRFRFKRHGKRGLRTGELVRGIVAHTSELRTLPQPRPQDRIERAQTLLPVSHLPVRKMHIDTGSATRHGPANGIETCPGAGRSTNAVGRPRNTQRFCATAANGRQFSACRSSARRRHDRNLRF